MGGGIILDEILDKIKVLLAQKAFLQNFITKILQKAGLKDSLQSLLDSIPTPPPHGWERVRLGEVVIENPKSKIQVREAKENTTGAYPFYTSGTNIYRYDEALVNGENIYLSTGGNAIVQFYNGESAYSTDTYAIKADSNKMLTKFLFYLLQMQQNYINTFLFKGTGLKHLQKPEFKNLKIPFPPIEAQEQIVSAIESVESKISFLESSLLNLDFKKKEILQRFLQA